MTTIKQYTSVSRWQFPMLRDFCYVWDGQRWVPIPPDVFVPYTEAAKLDQRSFGSLYHRQWLEYRAGKGFRASKEGRKECDQYMSGEARHRADAERPMSHYFDPIAYQFNKPKEEHHKRSLHRVA